MNQSGPSERKRKTKHRSDFLGFPGSIFGGTVRKAFYFIHTLTLLLFNITVKELASGVHAQPVIGVTGVLSRTQQLYSLVLFPRPLCRLRRRLLGCRASVAGLKRRGFVKETLLLGV